MCRKLFHSIQSTTFVYEYIISIFAHNHIWLILFIMNDYIRSLEIISGMIEGKTYSLLDRTCPLKASLYILSSFLDFETVKVNHEFLFYMVIKIGAFALKLGLHIISFRLVN